MDASPPTSWSRLLAELEPEAERFLERFARVPERAARLPEVTTIASILVGPADLLARAVVALGPDRCRDAVRSVVPVLEEARVELSRLHRPPDEYECVGLLATLTLCFGCGVEPTAALAQAEFDLPKELARRGERLDEDPCQSLGFASLAVGLTPLVPRFLGGPPEPTPVEPGAVHGLDAKRCARYLALAHDARLTADDVRPAYLDFVRRFPLKIATNSLAWYDLVFTARAVGTLFERRPLETVCADLYELLHEG